MGKSGDPEGEASTNTLSKPRDPKMQAAKVHMLNGSSKDFELHRGSDGDVLFTMVSTDLSIEEREYFSLCFYDEQGMRHWLYNDKKILRQLKGLPWEFSFEVKFYPTAPSTLNDDNARCNLFLQLRKDVATGRLPATIPTHALLAACVAQAEYGDADTSAEYEKYLREAQFVQTLKEQQNLDKVKELHREQKGLTPAEAELKYLETCKQLSMYGVFVFNAVDKQSQDVLIGICASGINIYKDTIRMHRFSWQNIVKISYRNNTFSVKLKAGELDKKKETTLVYKVHDYLYAKRVWKCGVEHHTFFRLIQPEDKPKGGLFRWGSTRFRYHGRTQFQTKMASQMFDNSAAGTVPRASGRLTQSCDNVNKENIPVNDKSATLGREGKVPSPTTSPGISYEINSSKRAGSSNGKTKKSKKAKGEREADSSDSSSSDEEHRAKVVPVVEKRMWWDSVSGAALEMPAGGWLVHAEVANSTFFVVMLILIAIVRFLHLFSTPEIPRVTVNRKSDKHSIHDVIDGIELLKKPYRPPWLWGRSGHIQTAAYGLLGHATLRRTYDRRIAVVLPDKSTATFDVFEPLAKHVTNLDITLVLTPGIANSSESNYIRTCVHYAQEHGYRCAVLNHIGALPDVRLTGTRIFSYGNTEEISAMVDWLCERYVSSSFIGVGFSMGANLTTLYMLRATEEKRRRFLMALSVCQGYSASVSAPMYHDWQNGRRFYNHMITENMKRLLRRNYEQAVASHVASGLIDEQKLWASTAIIALDENYSRRVAGFPSLEVFYEWCSCLPLLPKLTVPMIFLNAEDDPIIPHELWEPVKLYCEQNEEVAFISTRHGGHLGFLEGTSLNPNSITWLDKFIVEVADQAVKIYGK